MVPIFIYFHIPKFWDVTLMCCVRTRMEMYLLDMLVLVMVMLIDGTQFGYLNLLLLMLGVPFHNGLLNPRIDFVGLFL
jgi:hypothetical protein